MEGVLLGLAAMPTVPAAKRARAADNGSIVSSTLEFVDLFKTNQLSAADRQRAASEARAVVRKKDKLLEKILDVRIITTQKEGIMHNHVNLRVSNEYSTMVYHERALIGSSDIMFCFMASYELEPVVVVVVLDAELGRLVRLTQRHFDLMEIALEQFRVKFGLQSETYSYTPFETREVCSSHSRHFHLKIRVPTEMYLRVFPAMQVLGNNHACKRGALDSFKKAWEPLRYKFELKTQKPWHLIRGQVLADVLC